MKDDSLVVKLKQARFNIKRGGGGEGERLTKFIILPFLLLDYWRVSIKKRVRKETKVYFLTSREEKLNKGKVANSKIRKIIR